METKNMMGDATNVGDATKQAQNAAKTVAGKSREKFVEILTELAYKFLRCGYMLESVQDIIETILEMMVAEFDPIIDPVERGKLIDEAVTRALGQYTDEMSR